MGARIVITGVGPVTSLGVGRNEVWTGLRDRCPNVQRLSQEIGSETWDSFLLATVPDLQLYEKAVSGAKLAQLTGQPNNRDLLLFSTAGALALEDGTFRYDPSHNRVGVVISHEHPGVDEYTRQIWQGFATSEDLQGTSKLELVRHLYQQIASAGYATHSFVSLQQITALLHLHGPALSINNACASGLFALETAAQWVRSGQAEAMLVICGDSPRLITRHLWLQAMRACSATGVTRPFDLERDGFLLGEGAGAVLVETLDHASSRGARIYSEYVAGAFRSDAWKLSVPCPSPNYYQEAIEEVLETTTITSDTIDLLVAHGAGTLLHDRYEANAITAVFGKDTTRPAVVGLKPYVGHTLAGSALIELILALISLTNRTIPATLNWRTPDPKLALQPLTDNKPSDVRFWIKTATGFGGFNAAALFSQIGATA